MRQLMHEQKKRVEVYLKFFVKWTFLALLAGAVCGAVGAVFHHAVELAGAMFSSCGWLLYLLPVSGLAVVLVYRLFGAEREAGAALGGGAGVCLHRPHPPLRRFRRERGGRADYRRGNGPLF